MAVTLEKIEVEEGEVGVAIIAFLGDACPFLSKGRRYSVLGAACPLLPKGRRYSILGAACPSLSKLHEAKEKL